MSDVEVTTISFSTDDYLIEIKPIDDDTPGYLYLIEQLASLEGLGEKSSAAEVSAGIKSVIQILSRNIKAIDLNTNQAITDKEKIYSILAGPDGLSRRQFFDLVQSVKGEEAPDPLAMAHNGTSVVTVA